MAARRSGQGKGQGRRRHRGPGGFGGFGGPPDILYRFGGPPFGGPFFRRPVARRGDVRTAALLLLAEEPRNGYQIMQEIEERSEGMWRPSPGSVYPALQQLEDEGLVRTTEIEGRRLFELTDSGRAYVEDRGDELSPPWELMTGGVSDQAFELGSLMKEVGFAFFQVMHAGSEAQMAEAQNVLTDTRRALYRILAEGDPDSGTAEGEQD